MFKKYLDIYIKMRISCCGDQYHVPGVRGVATVFSIYGSPAPARVARKYDISNIPINAINCNNWEMLGNSTTANGQIK